jgi:hypothetical protein
MSSGDRKQIKQDKRAAALRDNLRRRKQQMKDRENTDNKDDTGERKK